MSVKLSASAESVTSLTGSPPEQDPKRLANPNSPPRSTHLEGLSSLPRHLGIGTSGSRPPIGDMQSLSLQGLDRRPEQAATSDPAQALEALLQVPAVAQDVPVPEALHANIMSLFNDTEHDLRLDRVEAYTSRQLLAMRKTLADSPVCFHPVW